MVFESIVVEVLNRVLGEYVENLDSSQLKLGIWGGDVVLNNLKLKNTALDELDLPVKVIWGELGKLVLKIPWKNLYGAPVIANVENLLLLIVPNNQIKYDAFKEEKWAQEVKQAKLREVEEAKKKEAAKGLPKPDDTFVEKLVTQIVKNVQVTISQIHIRYEDIVSNPYNPFSLGATLHNLTLQSTNENLQPCFITEITNVIYKVLQMEGLSVYWNPNSKMLYDLPPEDKRNEFRELIASPTNKPRDFNYILGPITLSSTLRLNTKPEDDDFNMEKIRLEIQLEEIAVGVTRKQYRDMLLLVDNMSSMLRGFKYRKYRPFVESYRGHYKTWWQFAYKCILEEEVIRRRRNWQWSHMKTHRQRCKDYFTLYKSKLMNKKKAQPLLDKDLLELEHRLDVFSIVLLRQRAELEVSKKETLEVETKASRGWFGWWSAAKEAPVDDDAMSTAALVRKFENAMTPAEKAKLYSAIDYEESSKPTDLPVSYVATSVLFLLKVLVARVYDDVEHGRPLVMTSELQQVNLRLHQRPAAGGLSVLFTVKDFVTDGLDQCTPRPRLINSNLQHSDSLIDGKFEINPLDGDCDIRLDFNAQPLRAIYNADTVNKLVDVFETVSSSGMDQIKSVTVLPNLKEISATGLQYTIEKHKKLDIRVHFDSSVIVVPHRGVYKEEHPLIVINLGSVTLKSERQSDAKFNVRELYNAGKTEDEIFEQMVQYGYDKFTFRLNDMQILMRLENEEWESVLAEPGTGTPLHILQPTSLEILFKQCLITDDARLPKLMIEGQLPSVSVSLSDKRLIDLATLFASIPLPGSTKPGPLTKTHSKSISMMSLTSIASHLETKHFKPKLPVDSLLQETEEITQSVNLVCKFVMKELRLHVLQEENLRDNDLRTEFIKVRVLSVELEFRQTTFDNAVTLRLGGVGFEQNHNGQILNVISTPMSAGQDVYLLTVDFISVNRKSPEFYTKYGAAVNTVDLHFSQLNIMLHEEAIVTLLKFVDAINTKMYELSVFTRDEDVLIVDNKVTEQFSRALLTIPEDGVLTVPKLNRGKPNRKKSRVEVIDFRIRLKLAEIKCKLANETRPLAEVSVQGIIGSMVLKKSYSDFDIKMKGIGVYDLNPLTCYTQVLAPVENEAVALNVVLYNEEYAIGKDYVDISVKAYMSCIRLVYLHWFLTVIIDFSNTFQKAQEKIKEASALAAKQARKNVVSAYEKATKISLDVTINAPVIIVPVNHRSREALLIDLGFLTIKNTFQVQDTTSRTEKPVLDELVVDLQKLSMYRSMLDENYTEIIGQYPLIEPITFVLNIRRNLSCAWFKSIPNLEITGRLASISASLSDQDYVMLMKINKENILADVIEGRTVVTDDVVRDDDEDDDNGLTTMADVTQEAGQVQQPDVTVNVKFAFTMENLSIDLLTGGQSEIPKGTDSRVNENGLAKFVLHVLSLKGELLSDESMCTSVLLVNCMLIDSRPGNKSKVKRLMERKTEVDSDTSTKSMVDVTFQQKKNDTFVDIRVSSINMVLSIDYLLRIAQFFELPPELADKKQTPQQKPVTAPVNLNKQRSRPASDVPRENMMTLNVRMEKPDVIIVVNMDDLDTNCLILNSEISLKYRLIGERQVISGVLKDLQFYSCLFNPVLRNKSKIQVLRPVNISLAGSTRDNGGLHMDVTFSNIRLSISPDTIELLNQCYLVLLSGSTNKQGDNVEIDYSDIWAVKSFNESNFWFLKPDSAEDALQALEQSAGTPEVKVLDELCIVSLPSIVITVEAGNGKQTVPMLLLSMTFQGNVKNWSHKLSVDSSLALQLNYYNTSQGVWEPLVEPAEVKKDAFSIHQPWQLQCEVTQNTEDDKNTDGFDDVTAPQPKMSITVTSKDKLELTVTKTCLEVLKNLGESFSTAVQSKTLTMKKEYPPLIVRNHTGFSMKINLSDSVFEVKGTAGDREIKIDDPGEVALYYTEIDSDETGLLSMDTTQALSTSFNSSDDCSNEIYLKCKFVGVEDATHEFPLVRANKRYYPISYNKSGDKELCGLVSELTVETNKVLTIRSVVQIHNHFEDAIDVYFMTKTGNELELVNTVQPNSVINLPVQAIYTPTSELFFCVRNYTVSKEPFIWRELQKSVNMSQLLHCDPKNKENRDPYFIRVVGEMEQIYYQNTTRHTMSSNCYNIHLRPTVEVINALSTKVVICQQGNPAEVTVDPGAKLHVSNGEPGTSTITIRIPNYLDKDWSCKRDIQLNPAEFSVWVFESYDSRTTAQLHLGVHSMYNHGTIHLTVYCPFWMINKTGLMLSYKQSDDTSQIFYHPEHFTEPLMYSYKAKSFFGKSKACVKVDKCEWSDKFSLDAAGNSGCVQCKDEKTGLTYRLGVSIRLTCNNLTKIVILTPFYVLVNKTPYTLECQEAGRPADSWCKIESGQCSSLWPVSSDTKKKLILRIAHAGGVSKPFVYDTPISVLLRLNNKYGGVFVDVQATEGGCYISFTPYTPGLAPVLIINHTDEIISVQEKECNTVQKLKPMQMMLHSWDVPSGCRELCWTGSNNKEISSDMKKDEYGEITLLNKSMYYITFLDGMQRVLLFTNNQNIVFAIQAASDLEILDSEIFLNVQGVGISLVNNLTKVEVLYMGLISSGVIWESRKGNRFKPFSARENVLIETAYQRYNDELAIGSTPSGVVGLDEKLKIDFKVMECIKPNKKSIRRSYEPGLWAHYKTSKHNIMFHGKINRLQLDNQLYNCIFPVVLAPIPPPKSVATTIHKPFFEMSVVKRVTEHSAIQQYKYFKILIQEFHVKIDIGFVNSVSEYFAYDLTQHDNLLQERFKQDLNVAHEPLLSDVAVISSVQQKNYFDLLHFSPLKVHVSFSLSGNMDSSSSLPSPISLLLQSLGVTLTDISDVVFKLAFFERNYAFLTSEQLQTQAINHYKSQGLAQLYVLIFGLDVIGNPMGLVMGISEGVEAFFYEPFQGAIQGPGEFAEGLALGIRSLFGHTVGGAAGAVGRITGTVGKGLAALSMDKDYQKRRLEALQKRPQNLQEGIAQSGKGLVMGVYDGVTGVVTKPITGAKEEGVGGFFKGVLKGTVGLVARPAAGIVDFASGSFSAVKRVAEMSTEATRIRPPRFFSVDNMIRPYNSFDAEGCKLLHDLEKGRYSTTDNYEYHLNLSNKEAVILTDQRLLIVTLSEIFGAWQVDFTTPWCELAAPPELTSGGIVVVNKKKQTFRAKSERIIPIIHKDKKNFLHKKMKDLYLLARRT